jgi:outer membrane protein assembly factor BamB
VKTMVLLAAVLLTCTGANAADWPQFRGPSGSGVDDSANPPIRWEASSFAWKTPIEGLAVSSPIVFGERIYVTTATSSDPGASLRIGLYGDVEPAPDVTPHVWKVIAVDKKTGKPVWEQTAWKGVPKTKRHPKSSQASCTPATNGKVVIAYFGSEGLFAFSAADGKLLWKKDLGLQNAGWFFDPDFEWGAASSPIIHKDSVIVQCDRQRDSFIAAYSLSDGKELWRTVRDEIPTWGTPTIVPGKDRSELVTNGSKAVRGYDPDSGKQLWTLSPNSEVVCTTPVFGHGLIFVTAGYPPVRPVYAIRQGSNGELTLPEGKTSSDAIAWSNSTGGVYLPSPLLYGDHLYTVGNNGVMTAYEAKTGTRVYQQRVGAGGSFTAAPVAANGRIYVSSEDGEVYTVKAGPQFELLGKSSVGEKVLTTPALSGNFIVIRGDKHLFAFAGAEQK